MHRSESEKHVAGTFIFKELITVSSVIIYLWVLVAT